MNGAALAVTAFHNLTGTPAGQGPFAPQGVDNVDGSSAFGYFLESILRHGGTEPTVTETRCQCLGDSTCTFEMTWQ